MKTGKLFLCSLLLLLGSACATVDTLQLGKYPERKSARSEVEIFASESDVKRPFRKLAFITVDDKGNRYDESEAVAKAKEQAKAIGADALVLNGFNSERGALGWKTSRIFRMLAIEFEDRSPASN